MTGPGATSSRGRPIQAVLAIVWVGLGFVAIEDGDMWRAAAAVAVGALTGAMYWWPESVVAQVMGKPLVRRRKGSDRVSSPGSG